MGDESTNPVHAEQLRAWLLSSLHFAITRAEHDRHAFLARARELDRGGHLETPAFSFFSRTSAGLCHAVLADDAQSRAMLKTFLTKIGDCRLRRALEAALDYEPPPDRKPVRPQSRDHLWRGLAATSARRV